MTHQSPPRLVAVLLTVGWGIAMLWATDAQMRESDQAALLTGAVELARGEADWIGNGSYNYDKQYLSYWFIAGVLKAAGAVDSDGTIEGVVRLANLASTVLFSFALLLVVALRRDWNWAAVGLLGCFLLSPVVAFSGLLLSPNLISGAFVLFLVAVMGNGERVFQPAASSARQTGGVEHPPTVGGGLRRTALLGLVFLLSFAAVAARQDAILLMPLLAVMIVPWTSWRSLFTHPGPWSLGAGCIAAMMVGRWIDPTPTPLPAAFFSAPTFVVYLAGGLGGCLLALLVFAGHQLRTKSLAGCLLGCSVLIPLVFYCFLLYTPRHLFAAALALLVTLVLPRGGALWTTVAATRVGRILVALTVVGTLVPWVIGARMTGMTKGRVVVIESTSYPTADGFWPMGSYASFFVRLAHSCDDPIDHNQEVWEAWVDLDAGQLPEGRGAVISSGLVRYGWFALRWYGREVSRSPTEADYILFDDRTLGKRQLGVDLVEWQTQDSAGNLLRRGQVEVIGRARGRAVLRWTAEKDGNTEVDESVSLRVVLGRLYGGNDFRLARWPEADWKAGVAEGFQVMLASRSVEDLAGFADQKPGSDGSTEFASDYDPRPWHVLEISDDDLKRLVDEKSGVDAGFWVACGMLPEFMDVRKYGK